MTDAELFVFNHILFDESIVIIIIAVCVFTVDDSMQEMAERGAAVLFC